MFERLRAFVHRHRGKLLVSAAIAAAAYGLKKYAEWKIAEAEEQAVSEQLGRYRKQQHFESNQKTCTVTVKSIIPSLREELLLVLDTDLLTTRLKAHQGDKVATWNELKVLAIARSMTLAYASALLVVYLRVQLNVIGGYLFLESQQSIHGMGDNMAAAFAAAAAAAAPRETLSADSQRKYLETAKYFVKEGLVRLCQSVRVKVNHVMQSYQLTTSVTSDNIVQLLASLRQELDSECRFVDLLLPPVVRSDDPVVVRLMDETRDVLDSTYFGACLAACLDKSFHMVYNDVVRNLPNQECPLAKAIPHLLPQIQVLLSNQSDFIDALMEVQPLQELARSVYETFSTPASQAVA